MNKIDDEKHNELIIILSELIETIELMKKEEKDYLLIQNENEARDWMDFLKNHTDKDELKSLENEIPGPGHPEGNQHTGGSPNRHPNSSIFNSESNGNRLRNSEIRAFWKAKGKRLIPDGRGGWIDPGY